MQYFATAAIETSLATTDIWGAIFLFYKDVFFHKWDHIHVILTIYFRFIFFFLPLECLLCLLSFCFIIVEHLRL